MLAFLHQEDLLQAGDNSPGGEEEMDEEAWAAQEAERERCLLSEDLHSIETRIRNCVAPHRRLPP